MNITKYGHACLLVNDGQNKLMIDPGDFTDLPNDLSGIGVLIVSEEHYDHFDVANIKKVIEQNPQVIIFSTTTVADKLKDEDIDCQAINGQQTVTEHGFTIKLTEGDHAIVYGQSPCKVLTVQVNNFLYYPSDSFIPTTDKVKILALPTSGPWHKISEAIDMMKQISCEFVLASHNGLHSDDGNKVANFFLQTHSNNHSKEFIFLNDGESRDF